MIDNLSSRAILDLAMKGVEKLTEDEMLAIAHVVRSRMMWPGLVAWQAAHREGREPQYDEHHPEACYRRGFQQGAHIALAAAEKRVSPGTLDDVRRWVDDALYRWRYSKRFFRHPFQGAEYERRACPPESPPARVEVISR